MKVRPPLAAMITALTLLVLVAPAGASAATTWTEPHRIPGTVGQANPVTATAPDGTDVVIWAESTSVELQNQLRARVRRAGATRWLDVPVRLKATFLQDMVIAPTRDGDFWVAYQRGNFGHQNVMVSRLDSSSRTWSKPTRAFIHPDFDHAGPLFARTGDGTLVVAAYARPLDPPDGDPVYRAEVAIRPPGGAWTRRFLSPADDFAVPRAVAANGAGDIVVAFIQGYDLAAMTVRAATLGHGPSATWKIRSLSDPGDSQRLAAAIGADGTAAVVWSATSSDPRAIRMATIDANRRLAPWVGRDVVTNAQYSTDPAVAVGPTGEVTVAWRHNGVIKSRHLADNALSETVTLSPGDRLSELSALRVRRDGKVGLLYDVFRLDPGAIDEGLRFRLLTHGQPGPVRVLTDGKAGDGEANSEQLWFDRFNRATVIYTRGDYPDTDFAWVEQVPITPIP